MIDSGKEDQSSLAPTRYRFSSQDTPNFPLQVDIFAWRGGSENVAILSFHYGHSVQLSAKSLGLCSDGQRMYFLDQDGSLSMKDFFDSRRNSNEGPAVYTQKLSHFDTESYSKQSKNIPVCIHRSHLLALTPNSKGTHYQLLYGDLYDLEHTMESFDTPYPYDGTSLRASAMVAQQGILHVYYPALQQLHCLLISDILEHSGQETETINRAQQQAIREGSTARVVDCSGLAKQGSTFQMLCMHAPENPSEGIWLVATTGIAHFKFDDSVNHGELKIVWERQPIPEDRNDKLPDEAMKSLVSVSTCGHAHLCWMDPMSDVTSRCSLYAVSNGTLRSLGTLDHPEVQNHEKGIVTLGCFAVPPTSSSVQRANEAYECAICFDEIPSTKIPNLEVVCLDCGHIFHEECLQQCLEAANSIRTSGKHITFNLVKCCVCSTFIRHPKLHNAIAMDNIREKMHVDAVARHQANMGHHYFVLENTTGAANPPVTVGDKKKPHEIIEDLKMYYYLCSRCGDPFFGGSHSCAEGLNEVPVNPSLLVCTRCDVDQHCPTHGTKGMMDQCSYCCNPAPHHIRFGRFPVCEVCTASKNAKVAASCKGPGLCAFGGSPTTCRIQAYGLSSTASTHTSDSDTMNSKRVFSQCMLCPNGKLDFAHMSYPEKINQES